MDMQSSDDEGANENEVPPPFAKGNFQDPVYEKLTSAAAQREEILARQSAYDPYADYAASSPESDVGQPLRGASGYGV